MDPYKVIKNPLATEKAVRIMEGENRLVFSVNLKANKFDIKEAVEMLFKIKVDSVNTLITTKGEKRAYISLNKEYSALDVATKLGLI